MIVSKLRGRLVQEGRQRYHELDLFGASARRKRTTAPQRRISKIPTATAEQRVSFHGSSSCQFSSSSDDDNIETGNSSLGRQALHYATALANEEEEPIRQSSPCDDDSSESASKVKDKEYLTNKGQVEGVWIFFRHGDRAPSRPLVPDHLQPLEAEWWRGKLPRPDAFTTFTAFSKYFPPDIHPSNGGHFLDSKRAPFGFLTHTGVTQTRENGIRLFARYNNHGYHKPKCQEYQTAQDFLDVWDIKAYSTNYIRTVMSVQSFLDGLLRTNSYKALLEMTQAADFQPTEMSMADMRIPDHSTISGDTVNDAALVKIQVRGRDEDTLNAFDRNPDLMAQLVSEVIGSPEFQKRDGEAAPLAARLANILPGLARKKKNTTGFNAAPSGINWIESTDHFICRDAHGMKLTQFTNFEHDDRVEWVMEGLSHQTKAHLAWRFRQWYRSPELLAAIAAPPLREITNQLLPAPAMTESDKRPFTIYSCHDVTILALLYAIGADFLANDHGEGARFWPEYASTLVFELVRKSDENGEDSHVVRILLNGKPVHCVSKEVFFGGSGSSDPLGHGPSSMLLASDFIEIVEKLEDAGGYNRNKVDAEDSGKERDMSNWTG